MNLLNEVFSSELKGKHIEGITCDSRLVKKDYVFFAIEGLESDGHQFIPQAIEKGACLILTEKEMTHRLCRKVENIRSLYAKSVYNFWKPSQGYPKLLGVTGTNGKTTTVFLTHYLLSAFEPTGMASTVEIRYPGKSLQSDQTTYHAEVVASLLNQMKQNHAMWAMIEISSHALHQKRLESLEFEGIVLTNITQDHLDYHGTLDAYIDAKSEMLSLLGDKGMAHLNADDPLSQRVLKKAKNHRTFSIRQPADLWATDIRPEGLGTRFVLTHQGTKNEAFIPLWGEHNVQNVLGVLSLLTTAGYSLTELIPKLVNFPGVPGRLERIVNEQGIHVFVDYAHTEDGLRRVLSALKPLCSGKLLVLFGCGGNRDSHKRPLMAKAVQEFADFVVITSDNPRHEKPQAIAREITQGFSNDFRKQWELQLDRRKAIKSVLLKARRGDTVLVAGKGHEGYQVIEDEKIPFSDRLECERVLNYK